MDIQQSCFSGVMLAVGKLVGIEKTIGDKVSSKSRFYNTFDYFGYERQVGDWPISMVSMDMLIIKPSHQRNGSNADKNQQELIHVPC